MKTTSSAASWANLSTAVLLGTVTLWLAAGLSRAADSPSDSARPIDLTSKYTNTREGLTNIAGFPAWKSAAFGHQVFRGVPFQIEGLIYLWGEGRSTNHTSPYPEQVRDISVGEQFQTLYVCHGAYYKSSEGTPVFSLVFRYADGSSATNTLSYASDVIDWKVATSEAPLRTPSSPNSMMAWLGGQFSPTEQNRLRYCMTAVNNPHPDRPVATIDLLSCKSRTIPFVLALTVGPSGLMKGNASSGNH